MKIIYYKFFRALTIATFITGFSTISSQAESRPQPFKPPQLLLYSDNRQEPDVYKIEDKDKAVTALFEVTTENEASEISQPVIVYIHGRALGHLKDDYDKEPKESEECCIPDLFSRYRASKVLMFHWPHWGKFNDYKSPAEDARSSGAVLAELLTAIDVAVGKKKLNRPLILISHSMGSIVLAEALNKSTSSDLNNFHTVAIFSSASRYEESWIWLSKIKSTNRYVFSNKHDPVLLPIRDVLGECDAECLDNRQRADGAIYIDISPLKLGHQYFVFDSNPNEKEKMLANDVVQPILTGGQPIFRENQPYADKHIFIVSPE